MKKIIDKLFSFVKKDKRNFGKIYYECYGRGTHSKVLGDNKSHNPYMYGSIEYDAWNDGWETRQ